MLINHNTKLIVQGIAGRDGGFHATETKEYGTNVVGGTSPGKARQEVAGIPIFNTIKGAVKAAGANTSVIFVPVAFAKDIMFKAADTGVQLIIYITEGIPTLDIIEAYRYTSSEGAKLIDPSCPGLISPEESAMGIMPTDTFKEEHTGAISRSGTLTCQVIASLAAAGFGQSTAVGVGGDPVVGLYFQDLLEIFQNDPETGSIALVGEIGGDAEERVADYIKQHVTKPVVASISGREAPEGKQMGHVGATISSSSGTAAEKVATFEAAGVPVAHETYGIPALLRERM